ncbi:DUF6541 family protein [Pseudarthrobacter sp. NamE5]|uniref:DUF6541 family protein n=1 Tax=Pseudarthrobacter sp. NamE5 TaxID=2576839 RepID=UPI00110AB7A3|nr:DUF6541 family protein [Pseudarthrobacter sp. NamE5]TLM86790.1 hypothetical protein FDW84_05795 [Pseudarthrobacter sp. NamE5]
MTWWQTIPTFASAALIYFLPGLSILAAAGVRRLNLVALAVPVSTSVAACAAVVVPFLHLPYTPLVYFSISGVLALLTFAAARLWRKKGKHIGHLASNGPLPADPGPWTAKLAVPLGAVLAAVLIGARFITGFGGPDNFSQTFDNVYHLNAVHHIAQTHNGSSLTLGNLTAESSYFYPAGMHDMMALLQMLTGSSVPTAVNVGTIVIGAVVWPLGAMFLVSRLAGNRPVALLAAAALSAGFSAFPYLLVGYGVLYPNNAAIALLPVALGLAVEALRMSKGAPSSFVPPVLAFCAVLPGMVLTHPSAMVALLGFLVPVFLGRLLEVFLAWRAGGSAARPVVWWAAICALYGAGVVAAWLVLRPGLGAAPWLPFQSNARAIGEILGSAPMGTTTAWMMAILTVIGLYVIARTLARTWWMLGMFLVAALLYMVVSSWPPGTFRTLLTGVWYNDSFRLAALLPVVTLPIAVFGAEWAIWRIRALLERVAKFTKARRKSSEGATLWSRSLAVDPAGMMGAVVWVSILLLALLAQGGTLAQIQGRISSIFSITESSDLVDEDEMKILKQAKTLVPEDGVVLANPLTGGSLVYALADRQPVAPHIFGERSDNEQLLLDHWDEAVYNKDVCPVIREMNAYWALDFGSKTVIPTEDPFPGLADVIAGTAHGTEVLAESGNARLVRMTACG